MVDRGQRHLRAEDRPVAHLTPPAGWMNDPNGPVFVGDRLHMFYQHEPASPAWGRMHWGHATSEDLVTWHHLPTALAPQDGGPDAFGCWSGSTIVIDGVAWLFYTAVIEEDGVRHTSIRRAVSTDGMVTWVKDPAPVVAGPPEGIAVDGFRDPFVLRDGSGWMMLVGGGTTSGLGTVLLYRTADLATWTHVGKFLSCDDLPRDAWADGPCWECPQLVRFAEADVLVVSVVDRAPGVRPSHVMGVVGRVEGDRFLPDHADQLGMGPDFYAPAAVTTPDGRHLLFGWIPEDPPAGDAERHWAGSLTLPRVVSIGGDGRLSLALAEEVDALRGSSRSDGPIALGDATAPYRQDLPEGYVDVSLVLDPGDATEVVVELSDLEDPTVPEVRIGWEPAKRLLSVSRRGIVTVAGRGAQTAATLAPSADGCLHLRLILDGSVLEMEADRRTMATARLAAMHAPGAVLTIAAAGGLATIVSLAHWTPRSRSAGDPDGQSEGTATADQ